jgi:hypothetical protein
MRTLNANLETALANQQGELILRVNTWTDATDYNANPAAPDHVWTCKAFSIESTTASAELVTENDYTLSAFSVFTIERGVKLSGVEYTIESGLMHVRKYTENYGAINISGSSYPNIKISIAAGDGTYQAVIGAFCTAIGKTAVFKNSGDAWLAYQFLPTGKALSLNKAELFENLLKQKYTILVYEESPNNLVFYNQDSYPSSALNAVAYDGTSKVLTVATAGSSKALSSTNGTDWTPQTAPAFANDICYGNSLWVAVGTDTCATSSDGITWTARTIGTGAFKSIVYANSLFVAVGSNVYATSTDGVTWTRGTIEGYWNSGTNLTTARYGHTTSLLSDGRLLVTGGATASAGTTETYFGVISGDAITWTAGTALPAGRYRHTATILSDGRILITGGADTTANDRKNNTYFGVISGNTITWTAGTALTNATAQHTCNLLSDNRVIVIGGTVSSLAVDKTYFGVISGDAITWTAGTVISETTRSHTATILTDNRVLVTGGDNNTTPKDNTYFGVISGDTITWTAGTALPATRFFHSANLLSDNRIMIIGGTTGPAVTVYYGTISADTITWTTGTSIPAGRYNHTTNVLSDGRILVIAGFNATAKAETYFLGFTPISITSNGTIYQIVGANLTASSTDGAAWTQHTIPAGTYNAVAYGNSLFVAVGASKCATSTDGTTWNAQTIPAGTYYGVIYANSLWVAVGANVVATSTDAVTWTARTPANADTWRDVIYAFSLYIAVASDGLNRIMTSADGITWTAKAADADFALSYLDGPTSYLDRQQSAVHFIWRDESATLHTSGTLTDPQWNLGFLHSTALSPTTKEDAYYKIFLQKAPVRLDITDGDKIHFSPYWSIDPTQTIDAMMQVSEHLNLSQSPAWYQEIRSIVLFDKTEGGALPSTIERVAAYTPLVSTGFDGNLTPAVNNLQALAQAVDDMTLGAAPATTALNDFQVGNGAGNWVKKTLAEIEAIFKTYFDTLYSVLAHTHTHASTTSLQGGTAGEYYHLTSADNTEAVAFLNGGTGTHTASDAHIASTANPHSTTAAQVAAIPNDGWIAITLGSPTRTAATTFTTTTDLTATWQKGFKLKFTDTTTKYAYVVAMSAYSAGSMTVTILGDALVGNPSAFSFSPIENPLGFPVSFTYTQTYTGFSVNPTQTCSYSIIGTRLFLVIATTSDGTSNATGFTMSLPVTVLANVILFANVTNNGFQVNGIAYAAGATTTLTYYAGVFGTAFLNTGTKGGSCALSYLI